MIEWIFLITMYRPSLCNTAVCEARNGVVVAEVRGVDREHCNRIREEILGFFGKTRDGRPNINGTVTECEQR